MVYVDLTDDSNDSIKLSKLGSSQCKNKKYM